MQVRSDNVKSMIASPDAVASPPPRSPSSTKSPRTHMQTGSVPRTSSVTSLQQGAAPQAHAAQPKGPAKPLTAMQHPVPSTSSRQDDAIHEFSELENKEALKRPATKKGGPVLRRVQSECHESHFVSCRGIACTCQEAPSTLLFQLVSITSILVLKE